MFTLYERAHFLVRSNKNFISCMQLWLNQRLGRGTYMAKTDTLSAFKLFPVHPHDWELPGMKWEGKYYFDKVLLSSQSSTSSVM